MRKQSELNNDELSFYLSLDEPDKKSYLKDGTVNYARRINKLLRRVPNKLYNGFYNPKTILKKGATISMIVSKRADGKTYAFETLIWLAFQYYELPSVWVRRLSESLKPTNLAKLFDNVLSNPNIPNPKGYDGVHYRTGAFCGYWLDEKGKKNYDKPFCHTMSLNSGETSKGTKDIRNVFMVVFDEFLSRNHFLPNEYLAWTNAMSTIGRLNPYTHFVMLGNPVSWESPYFREYQLGDVKKMRRGLHMYKDSKNDFSIALHLVEKEKGATATTRINNRFFPSNNNSLRAIVHGEWEMNIYPHITWDNFPDKVIENYIFFETDNDIIQCEVFIHKVTQEEVEKAIYRRDFAYCSFHKCNGYDIKKGCIVYTTLPQSPTDSTQIRRNPDHLFKRLLDFEWYFSDNETGETIRNFLDNFEEKKYLI